MPIVYYEIEMEHFLNPVWLKCDVEYGFRSYSSGFHSLH